VRLLCCRKCKTLEELPDFSGRHEDDRLLNELVRRHNAQDFTGHQDGAVATLMHIEDRHWDLYRDQIIAKINEAAKQTGFDGWFYEAHNTYKEDALRCYSQHHRPKQGCIDYWDDSKRIGRPTSEGRKVVKSLYKLGERDPHLCQWCPVHTFVQTEVNWKAGLYKENR